MKYVGKHNFLTYTSVINFHKACRGKYANVDYIENSKMQNESYEK